MYNKLITIEKKILTAISNIQGVLKLWIMKQLTIEKRIVIFKNLAVSKIVYFALLTNTPNIIIDELEKTNKKSLFGIIQTLFPKPLVVCSNFIQILILRKIF